MHKTPCARHIMLGSVLAVLAMLVLTTAASGATADTTGVPPAFGKLCGHVGGATWHFQGHTGTQYTVSGGAAACTVALRSVKALTEQTPHLGAVGAQTLAGPSGYRCAGSGVKLAHAGFCGSGAKHFLWAPRLP